MSIQGLKPFSEVFAPKKWELEDSDSKEYIIHRANQLGWQDNKVQVRQVGDRYIIEPFEENCGCPGIVAPSDYLSVG